MTGPFGRLGVRARVLCIVVLPATVIAAVLTAYGVTARMDDLDAALAQRSLAIAQVLARAVEPNVLSRDSEAIRALADRVREDADVHGVLVHDVGGGIRVESGRLSEEASSAFARAGGGLWTRQSSRAQVVAAPIHGQTTGDNRPQAPLGWVKLEISRDATRERQLAVVLGGVAAWGAGSFFAVLFAVFMGRRVIRPVRRLADAVQRIGRGHLESRVEAEGDAEFRVLADGINAMAASLRSARDDMQVRLSEATAKLSYQATHDTLTGLVNRREFERRLRNALSGAVHHGRRHALLFLDLDQFKVVNDTCGHPAGDELLRRLSLVLSEGMRERDTLARLGGDEFGVLLENCALDKAVALAEQIKTQIGDFRFVWDGKPFAVGASIGIAEIGPESGSMQQLLAAADTACYAAKDTGRNRVQVYAPDDREVAQRRADMDWLTRIRSALEDDRFQLFFQPIVRLHDVGDDRLRFEVLLRMETEEGVLASPSAFLPVAERYMLMPAIDRWALARALDACRRLRAEGTRKLACSVNVSGASMCDEGFVRFVHVSLQREPLLAEMICFEITETAAIARLDSCARFMREIRQLGVRFALDDFGTGLSSLSYLKNLPVDSLKIDGSFVRELTRDPVSRAMVEAVNNIGHVLGLETVAEYVETAAAVARLRAIGVDYAQGNYFAAPRPIGELSGRALRPEVQH